MATRATRDAWTSIGFLFTVLLAGGASAQETQGFKFNNLTISPFVNLEYTYDSNVDMDTKEYDDTYLTVNPGVDFNYKGNDWGLIGDAWYGYDKYQDYDELDADRYGESLKFYTESAKGLRFADEFVRHKVLDAVGDLALSGAPLIGRYEGLRAGHAMNNRVLRALFADASAYEIVDLASGEPVDSQKLRAVPAE